MTCTCPARPGRLVILSDRAEAAVVRCPRTRSVRGIADEPAARSPGALAATVGWRAAVVRCPGTGSVRGIVGESAARSPGVLVAAVGW
ncbi:hypothetical protein, partial [Streptomyces viridochromogenes]|uniref:hypothetical protein n=1 Tax=Streptomyces viridochromogenes TaxID=1938 RepID=UPI00056025F1